MSGILQLINTFPSGGFAVKNSLRFRSSASAYLSRTPSVAGNQQKFSLNLGVKRGVLGASETFFYAGGNSTYWFALSFNASNQLQVVATTNAGATAIEIYTNAVFRDPSAWYLITIVVDTTNATAANRVLIYANGVSQSLAITTSPTQNQALSVNSAVIHTFGVLNYASTSYFDGYMAEVNFIDGQALDPTSFGAFDATSGVWQPTRYSGTYGTNGFYLKFSDTTSTTTLCYDYSGNSNNWTPNNISLTAGSTYDSMLDSPTNYDNGGNGVGNYAVANPLDKGSDITASDGNLSISWGGVNGHSIRDSIAMSAGQWYCELTMGTSSVTMGLIAQNISGVGSGSGWPGSSTFGVGGSYGYANSGNKYTNSTSTAYGASYTTGDVIGIAFDATAGTLTFYKNGSSQGTAFTGIYGAYCFAIGYFGGSTGGTPAYANFGQRPFAYTPPTGYKALNTQNLPAPSIQNGSNFMAATLYTGNGSSQTVTNAVNGVSFTPDFVWNKGRSVAYYHSLVDVIRGNSNVLFSNTTDAEQNPGAQLDITTNGFISTYRSANLANNQSGATYVAWQWKAGGTAVTNTAGSITSSVSANTTSGFSVVTYTGSGLAATVGHGLGKVPNMMIVKSRSSVTNWYVYHSSMPSADYYLALNASDAQSNTAGSTLWNSTAPTSSLISLGTSISTNAVTVNYVIYCFAAIPGYSAFGSYTGNGSTDGPFVYCGFRPRYILYKRTDSAANWIVIDTSTNPYNVAINYLQPNLSNAEGSDNVFDIVSNGLKFRSSSSVQNASGGTYIYAAFAESPFKYSLGR